MSLGLAVFCLSCNHTGKQWDGREVRCKPSSLGKQLGEWRTHAPCLDGFYTLGLGKAVAESIEQNKLQNIEGMREKS